MRIGVFGGSFNPVHEGHLRLAETALSELNLDRVIFVPAHQNPLKMRSTVVGSGHARSLRGVDRVSQLRKAIAGKPHFSISLCELTRKGPSYTVDTLKYFKKKFGKGTTLYFLTGADVAGQLGRWKSFDEVRSLCRFVVASRPGYSLKKLPEGVLAMPMDALASSSTELRKSHVGAHLRRTPSKRLK